MPREAMAPCKTHLPSLYPSQRSHPTPVEGGKEAGAEGRGGRETDPGGGGAVGAAVSRSGKFQTGWQRAHEVQNLSRARPIGTAESPNGVQDIS